MDNSLYLDSNLVLEGRYAKRKIWSLIGLHSQNGPEWANMGKAFIKSIMNSAKGISPKDNSDTAVELRKINSFKSLDGIEFVARINITKDQNGGSRNEIRVAIIPDHKDYSKVMETTSHKANYQHSSIQSNNNSNRPNWA